MVINGSSPLTGMVVCQEALPPTQLLGDVHQPLKDNGPAAEQQGHGKAGW